MLSCHKSVPDAMNTSVKNVVNDTIKHFMLISDISRVSVIKNYFGAYADPKKIIILHYSYNWYENLEMTIIKEEENLTALRIVSIHQCQDSRKTLKRAKKD